MGLALPSACKKYIGEGVVDSIVLWNVTDLGYLTVHVANALGAGKMPAGTTELAARRLGKVVVSGTEVILGEPFLFDKSNVDRFDF